MKTLKQTVLEGLLDGDTNLDSLIFQDLASLYNKMVVPKSKYGAFYTECLKLREFIESTCKEIQIKRIMDIGKYKYFVHVYEYGQASGFQFYDVNAKLMIQISNRLEISRTQGYLDAMSMMDEEADYASSRKYYEVSEELFQSVIKFYQSMRKK